ncbi:regulatory-associated protein of TOR 1 isoform X4, partial [Tanacetum coccineum]
VTTFEVWLDHGSKHQKPPKQLPIVLQVPTTACLKHLQGGSTPNEIQTEPSFLQWLCLCLGKPWEDFPEAQIIGLHEKAPIIFSLLLSEPQPEVH